MSDRHMPVKPSYVPTADEPFKDQEGTNGHDPCCVEELIHRTV